MILSYHTFSWLNGIDGNIYHVQRDKNKITWTSVPWEQFREDHQVGKHLALFPASQSSVIRSCGGDLVILQHNKHFEFASLPERIEAKNAQEPSGLFSLCSNTLAAFGGAFEVSIPKAVYAFYTS